MALMADMMRSLAEKPPIAIGGLTVTRVGNYSTSEMVTIATGEKEKIDLPKASVLYFDLGNGNSVIVRPSGTEPKIKIYTTATAPTREKADSAAEKIEADLKKIMGI